MSAFDAAERLVPSGYHVAYPIHFDGWTRKSRSPNPMLIKLFLQTINGFKVAFFQMFIHIEAFYSRVIFYNSKVIFFKVYSLKIVIINYISIYFIYLFFLYLTTVE